MKVSLAIPPLLGLARAALEVDMDSADSIKQAASLVAFDLLSYYQGNLSGQTPGILPGPPPAGPYYWWEAGAMWGTLVDYWHYTSDTTYNNLTESSLLFQAGPPDNSFLPPNWTASLGNDDQGFWGMSAMLAAEVNFQNPPEKDPQWLALGQAVFNTQAERWDPLVCNGGLRWQIYPTNPGYDYKNTIANAIFFNTGARLSRYTQNATYIQWAVKTYDWLSAVGYIDSDFNVYDGAHVEDNCTDIDKAQFSYNAAAVTQGAAFMFNQTTGDDQALWRERVTGLVNRTLEVFFPEGVAIELPCELPSGNHCDTDQLSFKSYLHRWLATVTQVAPFTRDQILPVLKNSTTWAVKTCTGGSNGRQCGFTWSTGVFDATGAGQQMSVLGALSSVLISMEQVGDLVTNTTGGTSKGNPSAGQNPNVLQPLTPLGPGDKAGAAILTILVLVVMTSILGWMGMGDR